MDCDAHAYRPLPRVRPTRAAGPRFHHPALGHADGRLPFGDDFLVHFDLPGIDPESIELDVERNVLNVRAERRSPAPENAEPLVAERPTGTFTRQLFLGETLDTERIDASYDAGVLTLRIPVAEQAKPRRIQISGGDSRRQISS